jgi:hypothetical protein
VVTKLPKGKKGTARRAGQSDHATKPRGLKGVVSAQKRTSATKQPSAQELSNQAFADKVAKVVGDFKTTAIQNALGSAQGTEKSSPPLRAISISKHSLVKPIPKKAANARQAKELERLARIATADEMALHELANPEVKKARIAREKRMLKRMELLKYRAPQTDYIPMYADAICERVSNGEQLRAILSELEMTFYCFTKWLRTVPSFAKDFAAARENVAHMYASELVELADNAITGQVDEAKLSIDARKFVMSKILAPLYGDKITHAIEVDPAQMKLISDAKDLKEKIRGARK